MHRIVGEVTPRETIESACDSFGSATLLEGCTRILRRKECDDAILRAIGGPAAETIIDGREGGRAGYWPRVWATRAFLHVWDGSLAPLVLAGLNDDSWRVREMSAKVLGHREVDDCIASLAALTKDPVPRVRRAAEEAIARLVR